MSASIASVGKSYGLANDASANYAHEKAVEDAVILTALTGSIWPSDELFVKRAVIQIIDRMTSFAIHARRAAEILKIHGIQIRDTRWSQSSGPVLEMNFWTVVNKLLHARNIEVVTFEHGATMFTNLGDRIIAHVEVQSDRGGSICFCGYGLAYAYLSQIAPTKP